MEFMSLDYFKYFGVLILLLIIIWLILYVVKSMNQNRARATASNDDIFNSKTNSLFIQEVLPVDQKTKIVIVGRDDTRHVILVGENHSNVIETVRPSYYEETDHTEEQAEITEETETKFMRKEFPHAEKEALDKLEEGSDDISKSNDNDPKPSQTNIKNLVDEKKQSD